MTPFERFINIHMTDMSICLLTRSLGQERNMKILMMEFQRGSHSRTFRVAHGHKNTRNFINL